MNFIIVESKIKEILQAVAVANNFEVVGYPNNKVSADKVNAKKTVNVFYNNGSFPSDSGGMNSTNHQHTAIFAIQLNVAVKSQDVDSGFVNSELRANSEMNSFISLIWKTIMQGENLFLQTADDDGKNNLVTSRAIANIQKSPFEEGGGYTMQNAVMNLSSQMAEEAEGATGLELESVDNSLSFDGDDTSLQGTENTYTP